MFIRNGVKSILRERGRTVLFSLLIILLTVTLILSSSVLLYTKAVTDACDDAYRSIALVEYMGSQYPAEDEPDAAARAAADALTEETILSLPGVTAWTGGNTAFAYLEGYARRSGTMPYNKRAIIVVNNVSDPIDQWVALDSQRNPIVEEGKITYYTCNVKNTVYFHNGQKGPYIDILPNDSGFVPEKGKSYVLNGYFVDTFGTSREVSGYPMNGYAIFKIDAFLSSDELPYADYVEGEEIPDVFLRASEQYRILNNYIHVIPCHDVNDVYAFHQNELQLIEGHMPDPGTPYACVVSKDIADLLELKPGDTFSMDEIQGTEEERYRLEPTGKTQSYTVSGIIDDVPNYRGTVWVIRENAETPLFGYLLGTMSLSNRKAVETVETLQALVPEEIRVTLLDQGYINAVQPFREVEKTATNVLLVCSVGIVAVLLLFAFLYIGRQHIAVKIMVSMGTPGGKMALWFLSGALVICGVSSILGTVLGISLRPKVLRMIAAITAQEGESFLWYSETVLGVVKELTFDPQIPLWPSLLTVPAIIAVALLFCLWFLRIARRGGLHKRGKSKVRVPRGKSSSLGLGGLGFSLLSIRRGGLKSLVVPLVSMVLTVTVLFLGGMYQGWQNELDNALKNTPVEGMVVSLDGRYHSGLSLSVSRLRMLLNMEGIKDASVSN
ncbi:MAG: hypothetical protein IKT58_03595, partial [Oscillospiraceae bacterium]|nr:hypothetical protein [Oscillospiraceae bacterium]